MAITYKNIASTTVASDGQLKINFTNIPQTYDDLEIIAMARIVSSQNYKREDINFTVNDETGSAYYYNARMYSGAYAMGGTQGYSSNGAMGATSASGNTAGVFGVTKLYIPNYTSTTSRKNIIIDQSQMSTSGGDPYWFTEIGGMNRQSTSAITSLQFITNNGQGFAQNSTFYLYGIKNS